MKAWLEELRMGEEGGSESLEGEGEELGENTVEGASLNGEENCGGDEGGRGELCRVGESSTAVLGTADARS